MSCNQNNTPIFIVGVPRSGTTLLSALLSSHSRIAIAPETHFIAHDFRTQKDLDLNDDLVLEKVLDHFFQGKWFPDLNLDKELIKDQLSYSEKRSFKSVFETLMVLFAQANGKPRWGEKTPGHYLHVDTIFDWFPDARVVFINRDPRAVCASLIGVPWGNPYVTFHTQRWLDAADILESYRQDERVYSLTYEGLITDTESVLTQLCQFLEEDFEADMLDRESSTLPVQGDEWRQGHLAKATSAPISGGSLERWKKVLSKKQVAMIESMAGKKMSGLGYTLENHQEGMMIGSSVRFEKLVSRVHLGLKRHIGKLSSNQLFA